MVTFTKDAIKAVRKSGLFDRDWYLKEYPDVKILNIDPLEHYLWLGAALGRNPSPKFETRAYLEANPDLAAIGVNPLVHYLQHGRTARGSAGFPVNSSAEKFSQGGLAERTGENASPKAAAIKPAQPRKFAPPVLDEDAAPRRPINVSWISKFEAQKGWAYANNTERFIRELRSLNHAVNEINDLTDVALYFDPLVYKWAASKGLVAKKKVLRLGGARPLRRLFRGDVAARNEFLRQFDAVIALNEELGELGHMSGVPTYVVPNGIDLVQWPYTYVLEQPQFTVGFSANLKTDEDRRQKGSDLVETVCRNLGVTLRTLCKGQDSQIPHARMREDFYGKITCLVHPVAEGKEGSSNTIMEALACGVPVVTTEVCGFHSSFLTNGRDVLYADRSEDGLKRAIQALMLDRGLRETLSINGRRFAERHHDIRRVAAEYKGIFESVIQSRGLTRVACLPFPEKMEGTAHLPERLCNIADSLNHHFGSQVRATIGFDQRAEAIVISELCTEARLVRAQAARGAGALIIYDCAKPYFGMNEEIAGVHAPQRFWELVDLADVVTTVTEQMKELLRGAGVDKPIIVIEDAAQATSASARPEGEVFLRTGRLFVEALRAAYRADSQADH